MTERVLNLFAGPGGWDEGALLAGLDLDILGVDISKDAVATATAAGHRRLMQDVLVTDASDYDGIIASPPCPTFSAAGGRSGLRDYQKVLDVWTSIGWGISAEEALADLAGIEDHRTALLAFTGVALLSTQASWICAEQVPAVEFAWEDLAAELYSNDWASVDVVSLDSADFGVPSRRKRSFLVASRTQPVSVGGIKRPRQSMADALGWAAGHTVITRNNRKGSGGNRFSADGTSWCLTGSARSWEREDGERLTPAEAGVLVGFRADYPWQGSRSSAFMQAADVVSPPVAAHLLSAVAGR